MTDSAWVLKAERNLPSMSVRLGYNEGESGYRSRRKKKGRGEDFLIIRMRKHYPERQRYLHH